MAKYKFRLQTLLKIRENIRDEKRSELAKAYEADSILKQQLEEVESERQTLKHQTRQATEPGTINVDALLGTHRYELILDAQEKVIQQRREKIDTEIERRRRLLVEADRQVRILEKLREKQEMRHEKELQKLEIKQMDEVANRRSIFKDH